MMKIRMRGIGVRPGLSMLNMSLMDHLYTLDMQECEASEEFSYGLSNNYASEELKFSKCGCLRTIREGFGGLTSLNKFWMQLYEALEDFPQG